MLDRHKDIIAAELFDGTGAAIAVRPFTIDRRQALRIWFHDLGEKAGPVAEMKPRGLLAHRVTLSFGAYSQEVINQIAGAAEEAEKLARTLVRCAAEVSDLKVTGQSLDDWAVRDGTFEIIAECRYAEAEAKTEEAVVATCSKVIIPLMAAMTELIGYDSVDDPIETAEPEVEGELVPSVIRRRERSPRNRLACLRIHGRACKGCGLEPESVYGSAGAIIQVHHLEPLSLIEEPRLYDPATDLVPLCPNCHRAVHTQKPYPLTLEELRDCMEAAGG